MASSSQRWWSSPLQHPGTESITVESKWRDRRRRRRARKREAKEAEIIQRAKNDTNIETAHQKKMAQVKRWTQTDARLYRDAVRMEVRSGMMRPWDENYDVDEREGQESLLAAGKKKGLRIIVDCGMADLMCDAELKSLVTQLQLSYAAVLGLTVEDIVGRGRRTREDTAEDDAEGGNVGINDATNDYETWADEANDQETWDDRPPSKELRRKEAAQAVSATSGEVTKIMFSSLTPKGRVAQALGRDGGSSSWSVHTSSLSFVDAATSSSTEGMATVAHRIVVLSPDAPDALSGPLCTDTIYVVGGLCDYRRIRNATLDRALSVGVEARRLPIEEVFKNCCSVKILTVNQAVEGLVRVNLNGGDWADALTAVIPARKQ